MMLKKIILTTRPPFLLLALSCSFLGISAAVNSGYNIKTVDCFLVLIGAVLAHVSVNSLNEFFDFKSGLDAKTTKTPFSGGSGVLIEHPELSKYTLCIGIGSLIITICVGLYFCLTQTWNLLYLGILGVLIAAFYSPFIVRSAFLCFIAPGLGFGIAMVGGAFMALTGTYSLNVFILSLVPFFLVNNLLLLNQFPDKESDQSVGRKNLCIIYGYQISIFVYSINQFLAIAALIFFMFMNRLWMIGWIICLTIILSVIILSGVIKNFNNRKNIQPFMGLNVIQNLIIPILLSIILRHFFNGN